MEKYYVYTHELHGEIIYVGKGQRYRVKEFSKRSKRWKNVVKNNVNRIKTQIVKYFETEQEAYSYETKLTEYYKSIGQCKANINIGQKHAEETKKLLSEMAKGENNPMYGKKFSAEHKKKLSQAHTGKRNCLYGKTGAEHNLSKTAIAIFPNGKEIKASSRNELAEIIKNEYGISASMVNQLILTEEPFQARYKKHEKAKGMIVKYIGA
ncbi:NUMOD3 domain-containing DNA-binding protein [Bacillus thuringiensis]|uniref:NUMOD3 domain-containing DNA-binding protein n=1 Tax=Bacillus thuringiensis TaxID=1428 RepID=UPI003144DD6D